MVIPVRAQVPDELKLTAADAAAGDQFGKAVDAYGDTVVVGAPFSGTAGAVYVFDVSGGSVNETKLTTTLADHDSFGWKVSVHAHDLAVASLNAGVHFFERTGSSWSLAGVFGPYSGQFGWKTAMDAGTLVVGAPVEMVGGVSGGAAYVFTRTASGWSESAVLSASDADNGDFFGSDVEIHGDVIVVGAKEDDAPHSRSGSAYVFARQGESWVEEAKLTASDIESGDSFGDAVAVWNDTIVIGSNGDDDFGRQSGSAYVFERSASGWEEVAKLTPSDPSRDDWFGEPLVIWDDSLLFGLSQYDDYRGSNSGKGYLFLKEDKGWIEESKIAASDGQGGDWFGETLAVTSDWAVFGAPRDTIGDMSQAGSIYVYALDSLMRPSCTVIGTSGDDILVGTDGDDVICARGGDDIIYGKAGDDVLRGGDGNDRIYGGAGFDFITGQGGNDVVVGGSQRDILLGGPGTDVLRGKGGNDRLEGNAGNDQLWGAKGDDTLLGGKGVDSCIGGLGDDFSVSCE